MDTDSGDDNDNLNVSQTLSNTDNNDNINDTQKRYDIQKVSEMISKKYHVEETTYSAKFNAELEGQKLLDITEDLYGMFSEVLDTVKTEHSDPNDKARLSIRHSGLDRDIVIHCQPQHGISPDIILDRWVI